MTYFAIYSTKDFDKENGLSIAPDNVLGKFSTKKEASARITTHAADIYEVGNYYIVEENTDQNNSGVLKHEDKR
tara:strand:+ start:284 stop:505 length:222 start_codon:yes stop_codon:yes gene_type:complete